jgi:hypothetical protein
LLQQPGKGGDERLARAGPALCRQVGAIRTRLPGHCAGHRLPVLRRTTSVEDTHPTVLSFELPVNNSTYRLLRDNPRINK